MSNDPHAAGEPSPWAAGPQQTASRGPGGGKTIAAVLLLIILGLTALCCGLGTLGYYGLQQAIQSNETVALPQRPDRGTGDTEDLAQTLRNPGRTPHPQAGQIQRWLAAQVARAGRGQSIAPEKDLFYAAVIDGPDGAQLNLLQQIQLRNSLRSGIPEPDVLDSYTILGIDQGASPETARIAIIFYDADSLPSLSSWFLIKTSGQWQLYDWFDADLGRRQSDEYGNYFLHLFDPRVEGYDRVLQWVADATQAIADEEPDRARRLLQQAERTECLPYDHDRALLNIGWGYQHLGDDARAVQVFQKAKRPREVPGIWTSLAISQLDAETAEAALRSCEQLRTIYPLHPAADYVSGLAYDQLGQNVQAADHYLRCLSLCPDDSAIYYTLLLVAQPEHAARMVHTARNSKTPDAYLLQLFDYFPYDPAMLAAVDAALAEAEATPPEWRLLSQALLQHALDDVAGALQKLNALDDHDDLSDAFRERQEQWLVEWSLEEGELSGLQTREDFPLLMQRAVEGLFWEDLYADPARLESAMTSLSDADQQMPAVAALRGWAASEEDRHADAADHFSTYLAATADPQPDHKEQPDQQEPIDSIRDEVIRRLNDSLTRLGRFEEALSRFGDAPERCWDVLQTLILRRDPEAAKTVRQQIADSDLPHAAMAEAAIDAMLADWNGSADAADRHWVACLRALDQTEAGSHVIDSAAERRGDTAVRLRNMLPVISDPSVPGWQASVQAVCRKTASLLDLELAEVVTAAVQQSEPSATASEGKANLAEAIWEMNAAVAEHQRDWAAAVEHRQRLLDAADPEGWQIATRRQELLKAMLRSDDGRDDPQTLRLLETANDHGLWASYYVAHGMTEDARSSLSELDSEQRGQWYVAPINRPYVLYDRPLAQWLSESDQPLEIPYVTPAAAVLLVQSQHRASTADEMRTAVAAALGPDVSVTQVASGLEGGSHTRWAIRKQDALDVLVTQSRGAFAADEVLPEAAEKALSESQAYVAIDVLRSDTSPHRLAFALASQLSNPATRLVYDDRSQHAWYGDNDGWSERLKWEQRLPVDVRSVSIGYLMRQSQPNAESRSADVGQPADGPPSREDAPPDQPTPGTMVESQWLKARLAEQGARCPVVLEISSRYADERLSAIASGVDEQSEMVDLELRDDSALLPALRQGDRLRANAYRLVHP